MHARKIAAAQPSADQIRRASVLMRAVLPKNALASELLNRTPRPSSFTKRISAFQIDRTRVNTPLYTPTSIANRAALDVLPDSPLPDSPTALTKDALINPERGRADLPAAPAGAGASWA
jgi:hypothetical protein